MATAAATSTTSLLEYAVAIKSRRRYGRPIATGRKENQDCHSCTVASQRLAQTWLVSTSHSGYGNGWLKPSRLHCSSWNLFSSSGSTPESKVSEREEESGCATSSEDAENTKHEHANSQIEESIPSLDAVVIEATERVVETVEVAAQTVSSVGEIEGPILLEEPTINHATAIRTVIFWVCSAIVFGIFVWLKEGSGKASEFFAGYIVEQSLSVDNLVVFIIIFKFFQVPLQNQSRILTYGISGAIVFRATMILLGVATIQKFEAVNLFFASILIFTSYKLLAEEDANDEDLSKNFIVNICKRFIPVTEKYDGNKFFTTIEGSRKATPLFLTLAVIELSDIAFAVDSIPAVFGVTRDPFIVFSSNIFAICGLRSLYTIISSSMGELEYIQPSVAVVLGFIGSKMIADFFGFHLPREASLGVVVSVLGLGVGLSLWKKQKADE
ncbi:hypothetical protein GOP47_0018948 [Adiantum capillus-veneris]|uniref:Uncharacterized protein n=1 Tax=Adiantum capillus-veneris TaxID=13818 RepID=A0A9D4Z988_ADICA|nr:hypothetical protein GOP47_0018948 [Adiantum capillus-veneris]